MIDSLVVKAIESAGVVLFSLQGIDAARKKGMDPVGAFGIGAVTALGGGTLRDVLLQRRPFFWVAHPGWLGVIAVLALLIVYVPPLARAAATAGAQRFTTALEALGLGLFAVAGAELSAAAGMPPGVSVLLGAVSAVAGGVLRDVLTNEQPVVFLHGELFATASAAGAAVYLGLVALGAPTGVATALGILAVVALRWASVVLGLRLPGPAPESGPQGP